MEAVDAVIDAICSLQQHPSHSAAQHLRPTTAQPYTWCLHSLAFASGLLIVGGGQTQNKGFPVHVRLVNVNFLQITPPTVWDGSKREQACEEKLSHLQWWIL